MVKNIRKHLYEIAAMNSLSIEERKSLNEHMDDKDNIVTISVGQLELMLEQAFEYGEKVAKAETKRNSDLKNEIFRKACNNYYSQHKEEI